VLKQKTVKRLRVKLYTLDYRYTAVGIRREKIRQTFSKEYNNNVEEVEEEEVNNNSKDIIEL
jgi:hypothetical protein